MKKLFLFVLILLQHSISNAFFYKNEENGHYKKVGNTWWVDKNYKHNLSCQLACDNAVQEWGISCGKGSCREYKLVNSKFKELAHDNDCNTFKHDFGMTTHDGQSHEFKSGKRIPNWLCPCINPSDKKSDQCGH